MGRVNSFFLCFLTLCYFGLQKLRQEAVEFLLRGEAYLQPQANACMFLKITPEMRKTKPEVTGGSSSSLSLCMCKTMPFQEIYIYIFKSKAK